MQVWHSIVPYNQKSYVVNKNQEKWKMTPPVHYVQNIKTFPSFLQEHLQNMDGVFQHSRLS